MAQGESPTLRRARKAGGKARESLVDSLFQSAPGSSVRRGARLTGQPLRGSEGFTLLEMALGFTVIGMILMGIMATFSTGFIAQRDNSEIAENQFLTRQVFEELQDIQFPDLLSFNDTSVTSP